MKNLLNSITKSFILNEQLKVDAAASLQAITDIVSNIRVNNKRDTNRLHVAKEHLRSIRRHLRSLNERVVSLEAELNLLKEEK
jgi:hypothetical protein